MGQKALVIDVTKCTACFNCFIACKDEFAGQSWPPYSAAQPDTGQAWIYVEEVERGQFPHVKSTFVPQPCMLCQDPLCVKAAKDQAVYRRDDGIVIIDPVKSKGQKKIRQACPYHRIYWNEELQIPQKCDFCVHLLEKGWREPRCVEACPARVFTFGDIDELSGLIAKAELLHPEYKTRPAVYYIGLPKHFISGSIFSADTKDCQENVELKLTDQQSGNSLFTMTNNYGDFEFDGLAAGSYYRLIVTAKGYLTVTLSEIKLQKSMHLGNIYLNKDK
jgi:Fe-S-cluster-containing dehydrogenase component